ncbi:hypothetical protein PSHT_08346 [Puccinia striiformis]|uniref:Uncharacterized protein n=1 Tax=Puccinia striiformis TaxID=27350 RepID=A0A2S4VQ88_9BASI|nr:hypothetical protein PSHT_08346 [Puccinia striiformis]
MFSTIYVVCLLASAAFASPVALEPRGFMQASSYDQSGSKADAAHSASNQVTPFGMSSSVSDSASNSAFHNAGSQQSGMGGMGIGGGVGGFNNGVGIGNGFANGVGGGMQASSFNAANSASMSASSMNAANGGLVGGIGGLGMGGGLNSVMNSFQSASQQMQQTQSMIQSGQFGEAMASQQMHRSPPACALTMANSCGAACFGAGGGQFGSTAFSTISQFTQLLNMLQGSFGNQFGSMVSPFANLGTGLSQFISQAQSSQYSASQFSSNTMQQSVLPTLQSAIPGFQVPGVGF